MAPNLLENHIKTLLEHVEGIARGDASKVDALIELTVDKDVPELVATLAESISSIVVQKEAREFRLECIIEDLLSAQVQLEQAKHDPLTKLPNRAMFHEILQESCKNTLRDGQTMALFFIDLDHFKQVNDTMGHDAGDQLLYHVAKRLIRCATDKGVVSRLGGDEFTAILTDTREKESVKIAEIMIGEMSRPFEIDAGTANIGSSIGLTFFPDEADTPIALIKNADIAMYRAKEGGRNNCQLYRNIQS